MAVVKEWPKLYKKTVDDGVQEWSTFVLDDATVVTVYGRVGGQLITNANKMEAGKNAGRKNATTPLEQALKEAEAEWKKKQARQHYGTDPGGAESAAKRAAAPMLAESYRKFDKKSQVWVPTTHAKKVRWDDPAQPKFAQPKLDGHRGLACVSDHSVDFFSRKGVRYKIPHLEEAILAIGNMGGAVLDGEFYRHGVAPTTIGGWLSGERPEVTTLEYHVYDVVADTPFAARSAYLRRRLRNATRPIVRVQTPEICSPEELLAFESQCLAAKFEGAMLRYGDAPYEAGKRSDSLLKVKTFVDDEFEVVGFKEGEKKFKGAAIFECVTPAGHVFEVTAPGSLSEKRAFFEHGAKYIGRRLTLKYAYYTDTDKPKPFQPTAMRFREDI